MAAAECLPAGVVLSASMCAFMRISLLPAWGKSTEKPFVPPYDGTDKLLRKEVIQPHLPIRLPCYDFTPITSRTLGTYLPCGLVQ